MEDKEAIAVLTNMLRRHDLSEDEQEAVRAAIGLLGWTKLVDAWKENKKKLRDKKLSDADL
ncbi:MAG: hypothetical protein KBD06_02190 [Candidatus Pacebacteria bacterium]|nr:hypothetical protein [Candidatus Paceibacterota bacterium]